MTKHSLVTVGTARKLESATASLTAEEFQYLERCEAIIGENVRAFMAVGLALYEVQRLHLYRADYDTFEHYIDDRWDISESYGYQLIQAAKVTTNLKQRLGGAYPLPTSQRQVRNIASLPEEEQVTAWVQACERAGTDQVPTAKVVDTVAEERRALLPPPEAPKRGRPRKATTVPSSEAEAPAPAENSPNNEWYTPAQYIEAVYDVLGAIDLDPASCDEANETVGAKHYYTAEDDGLYEEWAARTVYLNPPYSRGLIDRFVGKLVNSFKAGLIDEAILLVNAGTSSIWFQDLFQYHCCFVHGRIKFNTPKSNTDKSASADFPSVFVYLGKDPSSFIERFSEIGTIMRDVLATDEEL